MYEVRMRSSFSAAHSLRHYRGKCEKLHGHNWVVEVAVTSPALDKCDMVIDFAILKKALREVLQNLDHAYLNELTPFKKTNPSSERIAKYVFDRVGAKVPRAKVSKVLVWETENSCAEYRGD
jgi:6-pyruvoyltetrahydropterin/6-carboxytetrahydropterin synthase